MSPEALIYMIIYAVFIVGGAWLVEYLVAKALAPDPVPRIVRVAIWGIAVLLVILILLNHFDVLHAGAAPLARLDV